MKEQDGGGADQLRDRIAELERRVSDLTRDDAIGLILTELCTVVPYDSCSVQELRGGRLVIIGGVGFEDLDVIIGESFEVGSSDIPNSEVIHRRRPLLVADTEKYRAFRRGLHVGSGIRSWLGVPLIHSDDLLGMIALDKAEADFYTAEHQQFALVFASLVAATMLKGRDERAMAS